MKRYFLGLAALVLLSMNALAEGISSYTPYTPPTVKAEPEAGVFNWTGPYIGIGAGYGMSNSELNDVLRRTNNDETTTDTTYRHYDGLGGEGARGDVKAGFDYRFGTSPFLVGVFGTWTPDGFGDTEYSTSGSGLNQGSPFGKDQGNHYGFTISPTYSVGGRVGVIMKNNWLLYGGAKYQWADLDVHGKQGTETAPFTLQTGKHSMQGWGAVAGIEAPIANAVTFSIEAAYTRYDDLDLEAEPTDPNATKRNPTYFQADDLSVMARINFRPAGLFGN